MWISDGKDLEVEVEEFLTSGRSGWEIIFINETTEGGFYFMYFEKKKRKSVFGYQGKERVFFYCSGYPVNGLDPRSSVNHWHGLDNDLDPWFRSWKRDGLMTVLEANSRESKDWFPNVI